MRLRTALPKKGVLEKFRATRPGTKRNAPVAVSRFEIRWLVETPRYHAYSDGGSVMDPEHRDPGKIDIKNL